MRYALNGSARLLMAAFAMALTFAPATLAAQAPSFADVWLGGPLDSIYNAEYPRVQAACQGQGDGCFAARLDTVTVPLAPVFSAPEAAEPVGWIAARLRPRGQWPYAALVFTGSDGREVPLLDDVGDWGYGSTLDLVDVRDGWIRPWLLEPAGDYWLGTDGGPGLGVVEGPYGLENRLWRLGPVEAAATGGAGLAEGVYMVLGVDAGVVSLRAELPADMDCMGTADPSADRPTPVIYRTALEALVDPVGRPSVEVAYPRGC